MPKMRYFVLIAILSTAGFAYSARKLERKMPKEITEEEYEEEKRRNRLRYKRTAFTQDEVNVIFVLGGPGSGKGTQCANLVRDYNFVHLSAGDLLREEQKREGSQFGELIATYLREGQIVPMEITISLLQNAMKRSIAETGATRFLIDGFPRKMDQALKFEEDVAVSRLTLFFECPHEVMLQRLLKRGESSGRTDDNIESIKKRFVVFEETSMPVVNYFDKAGKVVKVSCENSPDAVYAEVKRNLHARGIDA